MGRIRTIKPEFFRSISLSACPRDARLTFAGLWTEADDHGRGKADPRLLKGAIWSLDDDVTPADVDSHLARLEETGHIWLYVVNGERFFEIVAWQRHQAPSHRRGRGLYPDATGTIPQDLACDDVQDARDDVLEQGSGKGSGRGRRAASGATPAAKSRGTRIPLPYTLSDSDLEWYERTFPSRNGTWLNAETEKFVDYWRAKSGAGATKVDWPATWRNWLRRASEGFA